MSDEIEIIGGPDGFAFLGEPGAVDRFLSAQGLLATARELDLPRPTRLAGLAASAAEVGGFFAQNSGRWVQLTEESAEAVRQFGLMPTKTPGIDHAMIGNPGDIQQWIQIAKAPGVLLTGPMLLPMVATVISQQAMQKQMDDIADYLEVIHEKVDDLLRAQKDSVIADMIGVDMTIKEALTIRDRVGRVSDVTWSKVQATTSTVARTQAYAMRELEALATKLEKPRDLGDIARVTKEIEPKVREWLAVIAQCFQLQEGIAILELDRVLDSAPEELDDHRLGLQMARADRLQAVGSTTAQMLERMAAAVERANSNVLLNPFDAPAVVRRSNEVATGVLEFRSHVGIESTHESAEAKRWGAAAAETWSKVVLAGADGVNAAKQFGEDAAQRTAKAFEEVDTDGDGVPDRARALVAAEEAGGAIKGAASDLIGKLGSIRLPSRASRGPAHSSEDKDTGDVTDERAIAES